MSQRLAKLYEDVLGCRDDVLEGHDDLQNYMKTRFDAVTTIFITEG